MAKRNKNKSNPILNNVIDNVVKTEKDIEKAIENENDPLTDESMAKMNSLMKSAREMLNVMQTNWETSSNEFKIKDEHMRQVYQYNEEHRTLMPDNLTEEEKDDWDHFNGIDEMPEDTVIEIFGEGHPIIGVHIDQTRDRIKTVTQDFFNWLSAMREYNNIEIAYRQLLEEREDYEVEKLRILIKDETDPDNRAKMQAAIDHYDSIKYLDFFKDELDQATITRLVDAWGDTKKIEYWLKRTREKLTSLQISQQFILEISQFEKRYLPPRYHELSNMTLLYFMNMIVYANIGDPKNKDRSKIIAVIMAFDNTIRNIFNEDTKKRVLDNVRGFLEQVINQIYTKYYPDKTIPPIDDQKGDE